MFNEMWSANRRRKYKYPIEIGYVLLKPDSDPWGPMRRTLFTVQGSR